MKTFFSLIALAGVALFSTGCATAPPPSPTQDYADGRSRSYIAVRDFVLYAAPRPESPQVGRVSKGEHIEAAFSLYDAPWNRMSFSDGRNVFVFGNPIYPADPR